MDETQSARAMRILKAVDPESAQRTFVPLVDTDDFDPFRINRDGWLMKNLHRLSLRITVCFVVQNTEVI